MVPMVFRVARLPPATEHRSAREGNTTSDDMSDIFGEPDGMSTRFADATAQVRRLQFAPDPDPERLRVLTTELHLLEVTRARLREDLIP